MCFFFQAEDGIRDAIRRLRHTGPWPIVAILSSGGHALPDWWEIVLRLGVATLAGGEIGLNCDLHGKPVGFNEAGLVGLATRHVAGPPGPSRRAATNFSAGRRAHQGTAARI